MPPVRKSARSSSRRSKAFKEPAALKRLHRSLDAAQKALTELRTHAGGASAQSTRTLHTGLGKFVANARRDTGKLSTALKRDFEKAQKLLTRAPAERSGTSATSKKRSTRRTAAKRSTRKSS
jgi:hypothetical protein